VKTDTEEIRIGETKGGKSKGKSRKEAGGKG